MAQSCGKPIDFIPVTGLLDLRSLPDLINYRHYRWVEGFEVTEKKRLCRMPGWRRLNARENYNNEDLHDRLGYPRQHFTFGYQAETNAGFSKLFVGTQNQIFAKNNTSGNWQVIWDGFGGPIEAGASERRMMAGQVNDTLVFTNGLDPIRYHVIDQPQEDSGQFVSDIPDLETLNITKAQIVISWNNLIILANLVEDGERRANRIIWSDFRRPLSYVPKHDSLAGAQTLDSGETILCIMPLDKSLLVYTSKGIWEGIVTSSASRALSFVRRYTPPPLSNNEDLLAFKNTLVSTGSEHWYWGKDGIYRYSMYDPAPVREEWLHGATALIFDDIETGRCNLHVGGWQSTKKTIWWSWARPGENVPSMTMTVNVAYPFVNIIKKGFTTFFNYEPDVLKSLRSFILERCICTPAELEQYGGGFEREGAYCLPQQEPECVGERPANFYKSSNITVDDVEVEDYTGSPDADSLYSLLGSVTVQDICAAEYTADECNAESLFCFAAAEDLTLKEVADVYYRERCIGYTGCGTYVKDGYRSILRSGALHFNRPDDNKIAQRFAYSFAAGIAVKPSSLILRIGASNQPHDPNSSRGRCVIQWEEQDPMLLECLSDVDAAQHAADGTRPDELAEWPLYWIGNYLYFELEIVNPDVDPVDTGGNVCFSRWTLNVGYSPECGR